MTPVPFATFLALALFAGTAFAATAPVSKVDALFADFTAKIPGAAVVVVRDGKVLYKAAYGLADLANRRPITTDTSFHLASTGKHMTALAVLLLVEAALRAARVDPARVLRTE